MLQQINPALQPNSSESNHFYSALWASAFVGETRRKDYGRQNAKKKDEGMMGNKIP